MHGTALRRHDLPSRPPVVVARPLLRTSPDWALGTVVEIVCCDCLGGLSRQLGSVTAVDCSHSILWVSCNTLSL